MKKFALIGLIALVIGGIGTIFYWDELDAFEKQERVSETTAVDAEAIDQILINSDVAHVQIFKTTSDMIEIDLDVVSAKRFEEMLTIDEAGQTLSLSTQRRSNGINWSWISIPFFNKEVKLSIGLPESFTGSIETSIDVGSLSLEDLTLNQFSGEVNVGSIVINDTTVTEGKAVADVGEIELISITGDWEVESSVGNVTLDLRKWQGEVNAISTIGNITIKLPNEPEHYHLDLQSDLGRVRGVDTSFRNSDTQRDAKVSARSDIGNITVQWY